MKLRPAMISFGLNLRNPDTGQFSGAPVIPNPAQMKLAYPFSNAKGRATAGAAIPNGLEPREVARAVGANPVRSHSLGQIARAETSNVAETIARFLKGRAKA